MLLEDADLLPVQQPDQHVHQRNQLGRAQCPAPPQHDVIDFLKLNPRGFPDEIDRVQQVLNVQQTQIPRPLLLPDNLGESRGRRPVTSTGIDIDKIYFSLHAVD